MSTIEIIKKIDTAEAITKGLWQTGENKFVDISKIDDIDYIQKLLYNVYKREQKAYDLHANAIARLDIAANFYIHLLNRLVELKKNSKLTKNIKLLAEPINDTICDKDLEALKDKIDKILVTLLR